MDRSACTTKLTGELVYFGNPEYKAARQDLIQLYQSYPYVIVFASKVPDVRNAILWSREQNVALRARCGRCSTEGWCNVNNGIVVDVSRFKRMEIDTTNRRVRVGAGVRQGELMNYLSKTGYYTALGNEGILGLIGVLLGGGIALLSRHLGPNCDSLLETRMVLADGNVVTTSANEHSDLFWASRGAGGNNFGIVTSYVMRLHVAPKLVVVWECVFPIRDFFAAYDAWQRWAPHVPDTRLSSTCSVFKDRVDIKGIFLGSQVELGDKLKPMQAVPHGKCTVTEKPFSDWYQSKPGVELPFQKYTPMWVYEPFPKKALQSIYEHALTAPSAESNFYSLAWGGHTRVVPEGGSAFPSSHRRAAFYCEPGAEWSEPRLHAQAFTWVQSLRLALEPYFSGGYVNVLDRSIAQYGVQYYGRKNFARLQRIKKKWDPHNVFRFEQSVPVCNTEKTEQDEPKLKHSA